MAQQIAQFEGREGVAKKWTGDLLGFNYKSKHKVKKPRPEAGRGESKQGAMWGPSVGRRLRNCASRC